MVDSSMSLAILDLPSDPDALRSLTLALQARLAATETSLESITTELLATAADLRVAKASIQLTALEIAKLKAQIAKLKRLQFGLNRRRPVRTLALHQASGNSANSLSRSSSKASSH